MSKKLFNLFLILSMALAWASPGQGVQAAPAYQEPTALTFDPAFDALPHAIYGQNYSQTITVSGGTGPYGIYQNEGDPKPDDFYIVDNGGTSNSTQMFGTPLWVGGGLAYLLRAKDLGVENGLTGEITYLVSVDMATPTVFVQDYSIPNSGYSPLTVRAEVSKAGDPAMIALTGTVDFSVGGVPIASCAAIPLSTDGSATCDFTASGADVGKKIRADFTPDGSAASFYTEAYGEGTLTSSYVISGLVFWDQDLDGARDAGVEPVIDLSWQVELNEDCSQLPLGAATVDQYGKFAFALAEPNICNLSFTFNTNGDTSYWQTTTVEPFQLQGNQYFEIGFGHMDLDPSNFPPAAYKAPYSQTMTVVGGVKPYASITVVGDPSLAAGLTAAIDPVAGTITVSGTPTEMKSATLTITATDGADPAHVMTWGYIGLDVQPMVITPYYLPVGEVNQPYNGSFTVMGGTPPYTFTLEGHAFPPGVDYTFDESTGVFTFSGTPTQAGGFGMDFIFRDSSGLTLDSGIGFIIQTELAFTFSANPNPSPAGQQVKLSLSAASTSDFPVNGIVTFYADGQKLPECEEVPLRDGYVNGDPVDDNPAVCKTAALGAGSHTITADFASVTGYGDAPIYKDKAGIPLEGGLTIGPATTYRITGKVFSDTDADGTQDEEEPYMAEGTVSLDWGCDGHEDERASIGKDGDYGFLNLQAGLDYCPSIQQAFLKETTPPKFIGPLTYDHNDVIFGVIWYAFNVSPEGFLPPIVLGQFYNQAIIISNGIEPYTVFGSYAELPTGINASISFDHGIVKVEFLGTATDESEVGGQYGFQFGGKDAHGAQFEVGRPLALARPFNLTLHSVYNPSGEGQDTVFYAVPDGYLLNPLPSGQVRFFVDGTEITNCGGIQTLDISGGVPPTCVIAGGLPLSETGHEITIVYEDEYHRYAATSQPLTQIVKPAHTITAAGFNDANGSGTRDAGEADMDIMLAGLDQGCDGTVEDHLQDRTASVTFMNRAEGARFCVIAEKDVSNAWELTTPASVEISSLTQDETVTFGFKQRALYLAPDVLPAGEVGAAYNQPLTVKDVYGNTTAAPVITLDSGTLPTGLTLADGILSGAPTEAGIFPIRLKLEDSGYPGVVNYWDYDLKILTAEGLTLTLTAYTGISPENPSQARIVLAAEGLPGYPPAGGVTFYDNGQPIDTCYDLRLDEIGGPFPEDRNPVICHASLQQGYHAITAAFTNATEWSRSIYKDATAALAEPILIGMGYTPKLLPDGHVGEPYNQVVTVMGGNKPYTLQIGSEDGRPDGLNYAFDGAAGTITITGTPTTAGQYMTDVYAYDHYYDFDSNWGPRVEVQSWYWINTDATFDFTTSGSPADVGATVTFSLGATGDAQFNNGDPWLPAGWVTFYDGDPDSGGMVIPGCQNLVLPGGRDETGEPVDNVVTCATSALAAGRHTITATFTAHDPAGPNPDDPVGGTRSPYADAAVTLTQQIGAGDGSAPIIEPHITGDLGQNGWYTSQVSLTWDVTDAESDITSMEGCGPVTISEDQVKKDYTCSATSAGGTSTEKVTIGLDTTEPTVTITPARDPDHNGWYNAAIGFTVEGTDTTSGINTCGYVDDYSGPDGASATVYAECADMAGNLHTGSYSFQYDSTPPTVTVAADRAPNADGWYNAPVTFTFTKSDATSGVVLASCDPDQTWNTDTGSRGLSGSCMDNAGNTGDSNVISFKYDATKPVASVTGVANGANYPQGSVPAPGCSTTDALSGVKTYDALTVTNGDPASAGSHTATCSGGLDFAGNASVPASATYTVTAPTSADLSITKTDSKDPIKVGATLVYTLVVTNGGPNPAQTVSMVDMLDKSTTYVSVSAPKGWTCKYTAQNGKVTCTTASLAKNASATIKITVTVAKTAKVGASLVNTAQVSSATYDPNTANNSVTQKTLVAK